MKRIPNIKPILDKMSEKERNKLNSLVLKAQNEKGIKRGILIYFIKRLLEKWEGL